MIAEKDERDKDKKIDKALLGYDPMKWVKSDAEIKNEDQSSLSFEKIEFPAPTRSKHRFHFCQRLYEEVHRFLNDRSWAHAHPESTAGGVAWAELFVLFDTAGHRTTAGQHDQYEDALRRAEARTATNKTIPQQQVECTTMNRICQSHP